MNANTFCLECGYPSYLVTGSNPPRYAHDLPNGTNYSQHKALFPQVAARMRTAESSLPAQQVTEGMPNPRVSDNFIQSRIYWGRAEGHGDVGIYEELQAWRAWAAGRVGK